LLTLALPEGAGEEWLAAFAGGLGEDAEQYLCPLLGGGTGRTPGPVSVSVTAFGALPTGAMVPRSRAPARGPLLVTGTIGDAALGLRLRTDKAAAQRWRLNDAAREHLVSRYLLPQPRNALAEAVRAHAHGSMDVSDGLAGDLGKLCRASGVAAEIEA